EEGHEGFSQPAGPTPGRARATPGAPPAARRPPPLPLGRRRPRLRWILRCSRPQKELHVRVGTRPHALDGRLRPGLLGGAQRLQAHAQLGDGVPDVLDRRRVGQAQAAGGAEGVARHQRHAIYSESRCKQSFVEPSISSPLSVHLPK
ncbi:unnamed protein product, partial [Prorocentrum cordatum]